MDKEVLIHVKGLHMIDSQGEEEPVEIIVPGEYYFRNGSHYLRYEEIVEDSRKPTINYIKMSPTEPLRWGSQPPIFSWRKRTED